MPLNDPVPQESVSPVGGTSPAAAGACFSPAPLSPTAMACLQRCLARKQRRRRVYRAGQLRVWIDGEAWVRFAPGVGGAQPFRVPLRASYLEIFGDDDDGELLVAVFPLPEPEVVAAERGQHLGVTLEGGQTVTITIALGDGTDGAGRAYVIQLAYAASAAVETQDAEHPAVAAIPAGPRPETSTPGNPWISAGLKLLYALYNHIGPYR